MSKTIITSLQAPAALGPYSHAVAAGGLLFVSGQLPIDPANNEIAEDIAAQARQVMENLLAIVRQAGAEAHDIVKTTIFLTDLTDFAAVNEVYASFFVSGFPARATVGVSSLLRGARIEVEAVALLPQ